MDKALQIAETFEGFAIDHEPEGWPGVRQRELSEAAAELRRQHAEIERLNQCLTWEQHRAALAEDAMQRLTDVQQEIDCYGDGNVYRGQRSRDSKTHTITFSEVEAIEPVAFIHKDFMRKIREVLTQEDFLGDKSAFLKYCMSDGNLLPLYATPPKREPLTDEEIEQCCYDADKNADDHTDEWTKRFARAIERAHGIGGEE